MTEYRTLVASLVPEVLDEDVAKLIEKIKSVLDSTLTLDIDATVKQASDVTSQTSGDTQINKTMDKVADTLSDVGKTMEDVSKNVDKIEENTDSEESSNKSPKKVVMDGLKDKLGDFKDNIAGKMGERGLDVAKIAKTGMLVLGAVTIIFDLLKKAFNRLVEASPFLRNILNMFSSALDLVIMPLGTAIGMELIPTVTRLYERIMVGVQAIWKAYEEDGLSGMIKETFHVLWDVFTPLIPDIAGVIGEVMGALLVAIGEMWWDTIVSYFTGWWDKITSGLETWGKIFEGIWNVLVDIWNALTGWMGDIAGGLGDFFDGIGDFFGGVFGEGGHVDASPNGTLIRVAEAGEGEWIVPDSKVSTFVAQNSSMVGGTVNNYFYINGYTDTDLIQRIDDEIDRRTAEQRLRG